SKAAPPQRPDGTTARRDNRCCDVVQCDYTFYSSLRLNPRAAPSLTSSRIVFVPGMKPKPPPRPHKRELLRTLLAGLAWARPEAARWLREHEDRFTLVSWTYRFYGRY